MAVFTRGNYNCACSREVCDWTCTTYATMTSDLVPNTASQPFKILSKPFKSNADRIRSMSDEELADWLGVYCNGQTAQEVGKPCVSYMGSCEECWLDWLKQESEGE